jgi:glucose/arabinose dehydrogenase/PKD repeat protein
VNPGSSTASLVRDFKDDVNSAADRGLLGLAVDSQFQSNGYVYILYTHELSPMVSDSPLHPMDSKLDRLRLNAQSQVIERTTILGSESLESAPCPAPNNDIDCIPSDDTSHSIGTVISAPDGTLFVGSGDGARFSGVDERALRALDETSLAGKILHVNRSGLGLAGHAFCPAQADLTKNCTKVHAMGFRNPFRFTRRDDGALTVGDVGWGSWEEINLVPAAGGNYGWPCYEGAGQNGGYASFERCVQEYAAGTARPPAIAFEHAANSDNAIMAGPTYGGASYPAEYSGRLFSGDYGRGLLRTITFDGAGTGTAQTFATQWIGVDLAAQPVTGNIVYADPGPTFGPGEGKIKVIEYTGGNRRPVAVAGASPTSGPAPLRVNFSSAGSNDPEGVPLTYLWSFGDGGTSTAANPTHDYSTRGAYTATLRVSDGVHQSDPVPVVVDVANGPPVPTIAPTPPYRGGREVAVTGTATDPEDGTLGDAALTWQVILVHGGHNHPTTVQDEVAPGPDRITFEADKQHDADSHYDVFLTATDSTGRSVTTRAGIDPVITTIRLRSEPSGAKIAYGDTEYLTPRDLTAAVGFAPTVVAPPELTLNGGVFGFQSWSDGGAIRHEISIPDGGVTLTARYGVLVPAPPGGGPAPGGDPPGGTSADRRAPTLTLSSNRARDLRRGIVRGRASDPGGTVKSVLVGLARRAGSKCRWWSARLDRPAAKARGCRNPAWMKASLKRIGAGSYSWRLALGRRVAAGRYLLRVRAQDAAGNATAGRVSSRGVTLRVKR